MHGSASGTRAVVVGIDGSQSAVNTALWAVDEAVSRDVPLRLVYAVDPEARSGPDADAAARDLAAAEIAVRYAFTAVESTDKLVKIEVEILQTRPVRALLDASRSATLLCVGYAGLKSSGHGQAGSTAAAVVTSAHCPVAIVQSFDPLVAGQRWIVVEVDDLSAVDEACLRGIEEARLRGAPLRIVATRPRHSDSREREEIDADGRFVEVELRRRLFPLMRRHADVDIEVTATDGNIIDYLLSKSRSVQLLVVSRERHGGPGVLIGPPGYAALRKAGCSVLVCHSRSVL